MAPTRRRRTAILAATFVLVLAGVGVWYATNGERREVFCTLGRAQIQTDDGREIVLEDQGDPGPGDCDGPQVLTNGADVIGFDCRVREPSGDVVAELEPNQPDGRCGQPMDGSWSFPASWTSA